jgi:hypothetical protein
MLRKLSLTLGFAAWGAGAILALVTFFIAISSFFPEAHARTRHGAGSHVQVYLAGIMPGVPDATWHDLWNRLFDYLSTLNGIAIATALSVSLIGLGYIAMVGHLPKRHASLQGKP